MKKQDIFLAILVFFIISSVIPLIYYVGFSLDEKETCFTGDELNITLNNARLEGYKVGQELQTIKMLQILEKQGGFVINYQNISIPVGLIQNNNEER